VLATGKDRERHFLASHPSTPERVRNTGRHAQGLTRASTQPIVVDRAGFLARLDGLLVGADPVGGVFVEERFLQPQLDFSLTFPSGWQTANKRESVYAVDSEAKLLIGLEIAGEGEDPWQSLRAAERERGRALPASELRVGDSKAVRTRSEVKTQQGLRILDIAWLAYGGLVYQISGLSPPEFAARNARILEQVVMSFRPLSADERAEIRESRLRIGQVHPHEKLEALVARYGSDWSVVKVSVANALEPGVALEPDQLLKLSIPQAYTPREK
jgi:predicted Zn-dependent protease